jgi:aminocarboxymuconate-semialdehyde decarboxylase
MLRQLIRLVGPQRVVLGSDYPFPLGEDRPGELIESLQELTPDIRRRLLGDNALSFLGLGRDAFLP